jgi:RNA polymerase sigma-70 factor (ECF subfamily)
MTGSLVELSDRDLILEIQQGSLDALGVVYDRHRHLVYRTALAICNDPDAASDLLQDVFLRLHRFADRVDAERPLEPWLYRVTANLAYTWIKRRYKWSHPLEEIAEWLTVNKRQTPHQLLEMDDDSRSVQNAMSKLPIPQRVVVALYYLDDLSLQEIADILEIPVGTVKSRLHYGRLALKRSLGLNVAASAELFDVT